MGIKMVINRRIFKTYKELKGKTLKKGDKVHLKDIVYTTENSFLTCNDFINSAIFNILKLNKITFCEKYYGYEDDGYGDWPQCEQDDFKALTRVVIALFKLIEGKQKINLREIYEKIKREEK